MREFIVGIQTKNDLNATWKFWIMLSDNTFIICESSECDVHLQESVVSE